MLRDVFQKRIRESNASTWFIGEKTLKNVPGFTL